MTWILVIQRNLLSNRNSFWNTYIKILQFYAFNCFSLVKHYSCFVKLVKHRTELPSLRYTRPITLSQRHFLEWSKGSVCFMVPLKIFIVLQQLSYWQFVHAHQCFKACGSRTAAGSLILVRVLLPIFYHGLNRLCSTHYIYFCSEIC